MTLWWSQLHYSIMYKTMANDTMQSPLPNLHPGLERQNFLVRNRRQKATSDQPRFVWPDYLWNEWNSQKSSVFMTLQRTSKDVWNRSEPPNSLSYTCAILWEKNFKCFNLPIVTSTPICHTMKREGLDTRAGLEHIPSRKQHYWPLDRKCPSRHLHAFIALNM